MTGPLCLVCRLGVKDLRHRPAQALLLLLSIAAGAATLTLGCSARGGPPEVPRSKAETPPAPVDQPKLLQGTWVRPGGVFVEAAFASVAATVRRTADEGT